MIICFNQPPFIPTSAELKQASDIVSAVRESIEKTSYPKGMILGSSTGG